MNSSEAAADSEIPFKPLTRQEALALRSSVKLISPWRVVLWQILVGVVLCAVALAVPIWRVYLVSVMYGSLVAVLPNAILAWGLTRPARMNANALAVNFMLWEFLKIGVAVILMVMAPLMVSGLSWPAMLVAVVLGMKANWLALLTRGGRN
jgi:ATP synthase protein I